MRLAERLQPFERVFVDTAPIIYYVENNPRYAGAVRPVFLRVSEGSLQIVTSAVTLAECLILPERLGLPEVREAFWNLLVRDNRVLFVPIDAAVAGQAAQFRARYNLALPDAFQAAAALAAGCDAFLTNDAALKRVEGLSVIVLDEYEAD